MSLISEIACDNPKCHHQQPVESVARIGGMTWFVLSKIAGVTSTYGDDPDEELHFCSWECIHAYSHIKLPEGVTA
jgi:hypothetical protein